MSATINEGASTNPYNLVSMHNFNCLLQAANVLLKEVQDDMPITPIPPPEEPLPLLPVTETKLGGEGHQKVAATKRPSPGGLGGRTAGVPTGEKLTLEQVKHLPEKKLISLFTDYICDEMKRKYSYRCLILPDHCAQLFESFASEMRAKKCMLEHLKKHIVELELRQSNGSPYYFYTCRAKQQELKKKVKLEPCSVPKSPPEEKSRSSLKKKRFTTLVPPPRDKGRQVIGPPQTPPKLMSPPYEDTLVEEDARLVPPLPPPPSIAELLLNAWLHDHDYSKPSTLPLSDKLEPFHEEEEEEEEEEGSIADYSDECTSFWEDDIKPPPTIPAPSFPQVYQPELEVATICEISSQDNSVNSLEDLDQDRKSDILEPFRPKKRGRRRKLYYFDDLGLYAENGENIPTGLDHIKMTNTEESKFAMKCINALRAKKKDERSPVKCKICPNKTYTATATLLSHYRSHHAGIKPYKCEQCSASFTRQHSLKYHTMIHEERSRFTCPTCCKEFRHPSHYKEHLRRHTGETPFHCTDCQRKFKTRNTFKRHMLRSHYKKLTYKNSIEAISQEEVDRILKPKKCKT